MTRSPERRPAVTVLWEDQRGETRNFGPHTFLVACLADCSQRPMWEIFPLVESRPLKGDSKVLESCQHEVEDIAPDCHPVVAVFDSDRVCRLLANKKLLKSTRASDAEIIKAILGATSAPEGKLRVVLLERNLETLLDAVAHCASDNELKRRAQRAADKSRSARLLRDGVLSQVAHRKHDNLRHRILEQVPSFARLCETVAWCAPLSPPASFPGPDATLPAE